MSKTPEPSGLIKAVIFCYSAALAYIGYQALGVDAERIANYLKRDAVVSASESRGESSFLKILERRPAGSSKSVETPQPEMIKVDEQKTLDELTEQDREALSSLIDGL